MPKYTNKLLCFSPPVMVATFLIEVALLAYTLWRYKMTPVSRLAAAILAGLAVFQLAEFNVCTSNDLTAGLWSRVGFVAITALPVLGLHLITVLARLSVRPLLVVAYVCMFGWMALFMMPSVFRDNQCVGNYVIFHLPIQIAWAYFIYYYALLLGGLAMVIYALKRVKGKAARALWFQAIGYITFLLPTTLLNNINPATIDGIPSVMCGFAVVYALIIVWGILPNSGKRTKR